jgi:hypothetical protein
MGPLSTILCLPVGGPLNLLTWIARQVADAADQAMLDPTRIQSALLLLERRLEDGLIDEPAFEAEEALLLEELAEISLLRVAQASEADGAPDPGPSTDPDPSDDPRPAVREAEEWTSV